jgi:hypothetical protein
VGRPPFTIADIVSRRPAKTIAEVVDSLRAIDASLPASDGVTWFTKLYLRVTVRPAAYGRGGSAGDGL